MIRSPIVSVALALSLCGAVQAAKVKVWHQSRPAHFERAKLNHAVVSNEGVLRLSRQLRPLGGIEATHVWDICEDKQSNLYVATGGAGRIYKIAADGKSSVLHTSDDGQVLCLALAPDGGIYAGTGPSGRIVRIDPKGQAKTLCDGLGSYVWSLAVAADGEHLYAGTGPKGRIYKVTPEGKSNVLFTTKGDHVLCVAAGPDGQVYAGSDKHGLVYRIDAKGKSFVLYQSPQPEIRSLQVSADGVYVGTSAPSIRKRSGGGAAGSEDVSAVGSKLNAIPVARMSKADVPVATASKVTPKDDDKDDKGKAPAPSSPSSGENSLYRIAADGSVREVFREKALLLSVLRRPGKFFVGTGMGGQLYEVDEATKEKTELARLDHGQLLCLFRRADGSIVLGAGDPGKLYVLEEKFCASGTITSEVHDAKLISKWGSLRWKADAPAGTSVSVAVRSGNVVDPDDTWSDWSAEQHDGEKATSSIPAARFVQYRITLSTNDATTTPSLRGGLALRYATTNQAPEVTKVEVPNLDAEELDSPKKVKLKWSAEDANEDALTYQVFVKKDGWQSWVLLDDDVDTTSFEWDTTTMPSGVYRLKVTASDRKDNPPGEALTGERVSDLFAVSHVPPTVTLKVVGMDGDRAVIEATGVSEHVRLTGATFSVNGKKWASVFPSDGLFDAKEEKFRFTTEALKPGGYVVVLRVKDAAGNTGAADVVFTVQPKR